jgi:thioredoxin reductase/pSer/pThr/pTyr-binding forkhead associated (FHA) protein
MAVKNRFIIRRKDNDRGVDDIVIESEGLTIGRLKGNDLALNHRAVSRTHAGIKQIGSDFWVFNLSSSNGTLLNGELVDKGPLADGDLIQIGPYVLRVNYLQTALSIEVERELEVVPLEARSSSPLGDATQMIKIPVGALKQILTPGGVLRPQGTGYLTSALPALDERALDVFWDKRKREAGKIDAKTPLHPHASKKLGKAQFNWSPTLDLKRLWRKSYFSWGVVLVAVVSVAALFLYEGAYSPGEISTPHSSPHMGARGIALSPNESSCSNCHGIRASIDDKCTSCHTTPTFQPSIYDAHNRESVGCTSCHAEHLGPGTDAGLISYGLCSTCHNDGYRVKTGERAGNVLGVPHGGSVGYPVEDRKWVWPGLSAERWRKKSLPESWAKNSLKEQFHLVHQKGRLQGRTFCGDCHSAGSRGEERWRVSPRNECAKCHSVTYSASGLRRGTANCGTCHQQHGQSEDVAKLVPPAGKDTAKVKKYLAAVEAGELLNETIEGNELAQNARSMLVVTGDARARRQNRAATLFGFIRNFGALPWYAWLGLVAILPMTALVAIAASTVRRKGWLRKFRIENRAEKIPTGSIDLEKVKAEGPPYPHPVIDPVLCIGCHACVEACPHDVLTIVNGIATPAALDQCMEDTSCQVECPTNPKACIVINTNKVIPPRKVPARDQRLMTNIEGVYMIGDVSGVPLIKNAVNEGAQVVDWIIEDLSSEGANPNAQYDVAIVGVGPAGLSAAVIARQRDLSYVAIEQDKVVSTIQNYPAGKYIFYKPDTAEAKGGVPMPGAGEKREVLLQSWINSMKSSGVEVQEEESCTAVKREDGLFVVSTEKGKLKQKTSYRVRRVILAIGNRGTPMKLRVPGEEIKMLVQPEPAYVKHCPKCGTARREGQPFCPNCGTALPLKTMAPFEDAKVKYKLTDPDDYVGKKCIIVGAGNSAIEAACDLAGFKRDGDSFRFTRTNEVTLVIRSDFKGDLKLGNKMNVYDCMDAGKIKVYFRTEIKEITEREVVLMDVRSKEEKARIANDYVFAMIGGERPTKFLENIGIKVG